MPKHLFTVISTAGDSRVWTLIKKLTGRESEAKFATAVEVTLWISGRPVSGVSQSLSTTEARVRVNTPYQFRLHERFRMDFRLPGEASPAVTNAHVVQLGQSRPEEWQLAFKFDAINPGDQAKIRKTIEDIANPLDRRVEPRLSSSISSRIWVLGNATQVSTKDISASGIRFEVTTPCRFVQGERYPMEIDLPGEKQTIRVTARIVRVNGYDRESERWHLATTFLDISQADQEKIRKFIHRKAEERKKLELD